MRIYQERNFKALGNRKNIIECIDYVPFRVASVDSYHSQRGVKRLLSISDGCAGSVGITNCTNKPNYKRASRLLYIPPNDEIDSRAKLIPISACAVIV